MSKETYDPKLTCFLILNNPKEKDTGMTEKDRIIIIPYTFVNEALNKSKDKKKSYIFFQNNEWQVVEAKKEIPVEIENETIIKFENEEVVSHKYYVTV